MSKKKHPFFAQLEKREAANRVRDQRATELAKSLDEMSYGILKRCPEEGEHEELTFRSARVEIRGRHVHLHCLGSTRALEVRKALRVQHTDFWDEFLRMLPSQERADFKTEMAAQVRWDDRYSSPHEKSNTPTT